MGKKFIAGLLFAIVAAPAWAQSCPPVDPQSARFEQLLAQVQQAPSEAASRQFSGDMWRIWLTAPDARAQDMLDFGLARFRAFDFARAQASFDALIEYCPDYAEGYNQRAFVHFVQQRYALALRDLDLALARNPRHIAALSGRALTLLDMGREAEGQAALREALKLNPWLVERRRLSEVPGKKI